MLPKFSLRKTGMYQALHKIASFFWPELKEMSSSRSMVGVGDVITTLYSIPIYLAGLVWLYRVTDFSIYQKDWKMLLLFLGMIALFSYLNFYVIIEFREDRYGSAEGSFNSMAVWVAALIYGPSSLWLMIGLQTIIFMFSSARPKNKAARWNDIRNYLLTASGFTIPYLVGLVSYQALGGTLPIASLNGPDVVAAFLGIIANFIIFILIWTPYFIYALFVQKKLSQTANLQPITVFFFMALALPTIAHPFAILAAGLYANNGLFTFIFLIIGLVVVAYLTRQFSNIAESNRQQTRQLEKLESLGRAILSAPPDMSTLPEILTEHVPNMFTAGNVIIWMIPGQILYKSTSDWDIDLGPIWDWGCGITESQSFSADTPLHWNPNKPIHRPIVFTPILAQEGEEIIGGI